MSETLSDEQKWLDIACPICTQKAGEWCLYQDFETDSPAVSPTPHAERIKRPNPGKSPRPEYGSVEWWNDDSPEARAADEEEMVETGGGADCDDSEYERETGLNGH